MEAGRTGDSGLGVGMETSARGLKEDREGLTLPEIAPWSTQDHTASLWGEGGEFDI